MFIFIDSGKIQCKFSRHIHIFLNSFILCPEIVFPVAYIKQPMHSFDSPFHSCMVKQVVCGQFFAGYIIDLFDNCVFE